MPDHIHMLVSIPPKISVSSFMGYLKGKSTLMIFDKHANLKYKYGNRHFWAEGYYVSTVGLNEATIKAVVNLTPAFTAFFISLIRYLHWKNPHNSTKYKFNRILNLSYLAYYAKIYGFMKYKIRLKNKNFLLFTNILHLFSIADNPLF